MKIKEGYLLREVAGNHVVIPIGHLDFDGMITLNEGGMLLWKAMQSDCTNEDLISVLLNEYEIDRQTAERDVAAFVKRLQEADLIHE